MGKLPPVLLVEDNEDDAFFILKAFHSLGLPLNIHHCHNGQEALDYLQSLTVLPGDDQLPQLIVLDLKMPGKSGFEVLDWIRNRELLSPAVVVVLTSSTSERDAQKAEELKVHAYWIKPVGLKDMKEVARCICHLWLHHIPEPLHRNLFELTA